MTSPRIEANELRERISRVEATIERVAKTSFERRIEALHQAARSLEDPEQELGRTLRMELEATSGLSSEGIAWALDTTLGAITREALEAIVTAASLGAPGTLVPRGLVAIVLSGNVTTAPLFALTMPLLFGNAVVAKASRRDGTVAHAFAHALERTDSEFAASLAIVDFEGGDTHLEDILLSRAHAVSVYGSDSTSATLRARTPIGAAFLVHGHGLGVGFVSREVQQDPASRADAASRLALDIAAYDQRGCLSPHAIVVEGTEQEAERFAVDLTELGLAPLSKRMPRGPLPLAIGGAQLAYRSLGIARGGLFEGDGYCASAEGIAAIRPSPGYRNVQVVALDSRAGFGALVAPLGSHLKIIGVAGDEASQKALASSLMPPMAPRIVAAGRMQIPPIDAAWDGELPYAGLVRYAAGP